MILAIDPGLRNLAWCAMVNGAVQEMNRSDIFGGGSVNCNDTFAAISQWCDRHQYLFDAADVVVIEKQFIDTKLRLSSCLATVQSVLQCRSYKKHILVHAGTIKRVYAISRGNHRLNKLASVERAQGLNRELFESQSGKLDDMADAYLLAHYAYTHFSDAFMLNFSKSVLKDNGKGVGNPGRRGLTAVKPCSRVPVSSAINATRKCDEHRVDEGEVGAERVLGRKREECG